MTVLGSISQNQNQRDMPGNLFARKLRVIPFTNMV